MVRNRDNLGIAPRTRLRRVALVVLTAAVDDTFACLEAARAGVVEAGIHDMRVAAKRLREGLRLFEPVYRRQEFEPALGRVDTLNDSLGLVRDEDVLLEHLGLLDGSAAPLLQDLRESIRGERAAHQAAVQGVLDQLAADAFPDQLRALVDSGRHGPNHAVAGMSCRRFARTEISTRLSRVQKRMAKVQGESDADGLHRVRVANKHLRYAIEPFLGLFSKRLQVAYRRVAELHTALGDLHDLDVVQERLAAFAAETARTTEAEPLLQRVGELRSREYQRVAGLVQPDGEAAFVRLLADAIG